MDREANDRHWNRRAWVITRTGAIFWILAMLTLLMLGAG